MRGGLAASRRKAVVSAIADLAVTAAVGVVTGCSAAPTSGGPSSEATVAALPTVAAWPAHSPPAFEVPTSTLLATLLTGLPRYESPNQRGRGTVPARWYGRPVVLPVLGTAPGWVQVRLPQRPNGSTAWVPASDVRLSSTPYVIVIDLATTHLSLYDHGRCVFSAPAGVGTRDDPTPAGGYFVAFAEGPPEPNPGYGPFILVTSAHSPKITDWEGSGDAVIGIHGPLGDDGEIGTTGARISHGCIRLHDSALKRLSRVPAGTPVYILQ